MNLNGDEKRIRRLFREMRLEDQRRAPEFASVLAAANSGIARSQNRARPLRFAMAIAMLCAALLIAMVIALTDSKPRGPSPTNQALSPPAQPEAPPGVAPSKPGGEAARAEPRRAIIKRRHRRRSNQIEIAMKSLFAWTSPTASLLTSPDNELLKSLPRLGESLPTIKSFSPDQFN